MCYNIGVREDFLFLLTFLTDRAKDRGLETIHFSNEKFCDFRPGESNGFRKTHRTSKSKERPGYIYENNDSFETSYH